MRMQAAAEARQQATREARSDLLSAAEARGALTQGKVTQIWPRQICGHQELVCRSKRARVTPV